MLVRIPSEGKIFGVCAGLGNYFNIDPTIIRVILLVLLFISNGFVILLYIIMAVVIPPNTKKPVKNSDIGQSIDDLQKELTKSSNTNRLKNYIGIGLIVFGAWLLVGQFIPVFSWAYAWPIMVIVLGIIILGSGRNKK